MEPLITLHKQIFDSLVRWQNIYYHFQIYYCRCAHIFLGKCLPPINGKRNSLLRTAYGISPDRNIRDKQCNMRVNGRANLPATVQNVPPAQSANKCLDLSTSEDVSETSKTKTSIDDDQPDFKRKLNCDDKKSNQNVRNDPLPCNKVVTEISESTTRPIVRVSSAPHLRCQKVESIKQ